MSILIFLVLVFGTLDFGRALYTYHTLSYAARAATRYAIVRGAACSSVVTGCPATQASVTSYIESISPNLSTSSLTVNVSWVVTGNTGCPSGTTPTNSPGCSVEVSLSYKFSWLFSFLPTTTMSSTSEMVISQ